jgi:hypothetical protein
VRFKCRNPAAGGAARRASTLDFPGGNVGVRNRPTASDLQLILRFVLAIHCGTHAQRQFLVCASRVDGAFSGAMSRVAVP